MPTRTRAINRTCYAMQRRVMGWEVIATDTVPSGPSAVRNAEGARLPTGPRSCLGGSSPIRPVHGKGVTAVPTLARRSPVRPTTAPRVASEVAPPRVSVAAVRHGKPSKQRITRARLAVFTRDDWTCQVCGRHIPPTRDNERSGEFAPMDRNDYLELDHIVPRSAGGLFVIDNLRAVCSPCNSRKSADTAFAGFPERIARAIDILQRRTPNAETARAAIEALMGEPV